MSTKSNKQLLSISGRVITQDYDDALAISTIIEQTDMAVFNTQKIITHYKDDIDQEWWTIKEIGKNRAGETLYIKVIHNSQDKPVDDILSREPFNNL